MPLYAWRLMMPALAQDFEASVDQHGMRLSDKPAGRDDTVARLVRC